MRSYSVKESPIGSAVSEILRYTDKHRGTDILLLYYKDTFWHSLQKIVNLYIPISP